MSPKPYRLPDSFLIHYNGIDQEHMHLVDLINECSEMIVSGSHDAFCAKLDSVVACMRKHFTHEESKMRDLGYHGLDWHTEHHKEAVTHTERLLANARRDGDKDHKILHALFNDIVSDVARADLKFREFLEGEGLVEPQR